MSHSCCIKQKLRKGLWSPEEDEKLYNYITRFGVGCWSSVPILSGLQRCGKSCRLRWINYLRPDVKRGRFSQQEEDLIIRLHEFLGNRWAQIAAQLPGRTDNEIKNFWNSRLKKKLLKQGIDPSTHQPITEKDKKICTENASLQLPHTKQVFDPFFLDSCGFNSSFYNQNPFDQMSNLTNLDQRNSRMSSDDRSGYQMINNMVQNGSISWDSDQKYECQIDGIKIEEDQGKQISPWQERLIQTENSGDLRDYPLTSLSGEDLSGENLDYVFNHL